MATNAERPRRFDLRTTIPLATETLVHMARQPKRSWVVPALTLITGIAFLLLMFELLAFPGPVSALALEGGLRSRLAADYGADPVVARIHELRLTIVEDVLGLEEGDSSEPPALVVLMQEPVPSATPKASQVPSPTLPVPSATLALTEEAALETSQTPLPSPSETPLPPTAAVTAEPEGYCSRLSITSIWIDGDDVEARVRNDGSRNAYLIETFFSWPDLPEPAYVDWFKFDGDRYYTSDDSSSPTVSTGDHEKLGDRDSEKWEVDFDDGPDGGIYGSFSVTLTFDVSGQDAHCSVSGSTYRTPPGATPTDTPEPPTPEPTVPPSDTPVPTATETPTPIDTPTPESPTETPTPT